MPGVRGAVLPPPRRLDPRSRLRLQTRRRGDKETRRSHVAGFSPCLHLSLSPCLRGILETTLKRTATLIHASIVGWHPSLPESVRGAAARFRVGRPRDSGSTDLHIASTASARGPRCCHR